MKSAPSSPNNSGSEMATEIEPERARLLVFIPSPIEVQRFVLGGAFADLDREFHLSYVLLESDRERLEPLVRGALPEAPLHFVDLSADRMQAWSRLFNAACYQFAEDSKSFALRINRDYAGAEGDRRLRADRAAVQSRKRIAQATYRVFRNPWIQRLRARLFPKASSAALPAVLRGKALMFDPGSYAELRRETYVTLGRHPALVSLLDETRPDLIVIPTSLLDPFCNEILWLSEERRLKTLLIQSGWDNLSSKGIIQHQPTFAAVWGRQSGRHASAIQKVPASAVRVLGAPHYEALLQVAPGRRAEVRSELAIREEETLLLFGGSFRQFDETKALRVLDALVARAGRPVKILYRPHPYRLDRIEEDNFFEMDWRHVVFDAEMKDRYLRSKREPGYLGSARPSYSMHYLAGVLAASDAVISPMSTLILEAMLLGKPTMAVAYSEVSETASTYDAGTASEMTHFDIIKGRDAALIWCDAGDRFEAEVLRLLQRVGSRDLREEQAKLLEEIVRTEPGDYASRLLHVLKSDIIPALREAVP